MTSEFCLHLALISFILRTSWKSLPLGEVNSGGTPYTTPPPPPPAPIDFSPEHRDGFVTRAIS